MILVFCIYTFLTIGVIFLLLSLFGMLFRRRCIKTYTVHVSGSIVGFQKRYNSDKRFTYFPVVRYIIGDEEYDGMAKFGRGSLIDYSACNFKVNLLVHPKRHDKFYVIMDDVVCKSIYHLFLVIGIITSFVGFLCFTLDLLIIH